jgi:protein-disulfide isomerase
MFSLKNFGLGLLVGIMASAPSSAGAGATAPSSQKDSTPKASNDGTGSQIPTNTVSPGGTNDDGKGLTETVGTTGGEATPTSATNTTSAELNDASLEKKVAEILEKNPQIIVQALQSFQQKQIRAQEDKIKASLMKYKNDIAKESSSVVLGKKDAEVKLVVFLDPNCPHCRPFSMALSKARENFPNLAIYIRQWAILGKDSEDVIRGLWAIKQQGEDKFNAALKAIASSEEKYTYAKLVSWVKDHNLNLKKFEEDADSQATKDVIEETKKLATDIGFEGTPTSLLIDKNGIRLVMPTDEKSLESILKGTDKQGPAKA